MHKLTEEFFFGKMTMWAFLRPFLFPKDLSLIREVFFYGKTPVSRKVKPCLKHY